MNREVGKILRDILISSMSLTEQQVWLENLDFKIPETKGLFIMIQQTSSVPYSSTNKFVENEAETSIEEQITSLTREEYLINVMSKDTEARTRKEEVMLAFSSYFSRDKQNKYNFKIGKVGAMSNLSELEGSGMLSRYGFTVPVLARYDLTRDVVYYDTFSEEIETNK